jgi:uncharacterized membrane protein YagU involved in acid resistance
MINKIRKGIVGGILGTTFMTFVIFGGPLVGLPKVSPPQMLSSMFGFPILDGWLMHFIIGIIFAMMYVFAIGRILKKIINAMLKGAIFGVFAFIFGQFMINILGALFTEAPPMTGSVLQIMMESLLGHITFGIVVALYANE